MSKLAAFVRLDFVTVKPYFTLKTMLIYAAVAVYLTAFSDNIASGMGVGMMLGTMFVGYPFALGEKSGMDSLYVTLAADRKTVVRGRYIFTLALDVLAMLLSSALGFLGAAAARAFGADIMFDGSIAMVGVMAAVFAVIQAVQLPFYFKLGYSKAKFLSMVPLVALMSGYIALLPAIKSLGAPPQWLIGMLTGGWIVPLAAAAVAVMLLVSYRFSARFYAKREF